MTARAAATKRASQVYLLRFISTRVIMGAKCSTFPESPNGRTERCGRPRTSVLTTEVARPHSLQ